MTPAEDRVLDAVERCWERYGFAKVTVDDIAAESGLSRATLYRMFPGGKDVLFDALRHRHINVFFTELQLAVADCTSLDELVVNSTVFATQCLRADEFLAALLATEPGEALGQLTVDGLPRIIRIANLTLTPMVAEYMPLDEARHWVDILIRLTISYFLAPSPTVDLGDPASAARFLGPFLSLATRTEFA